MSGLAESLTEQVTSLAELTHNNLVNVKPTELIKRGARQICHFAKKYWWLLIYYLLASKLYRIIRGPRRRSHSKKLNRRATTDSDSSMDRVCGDGSAVDPRSLVDENAYVASTPGSTNQVLVGDGVIIVNRNDRYVEVYERKNVERLENVDEQVESMLKEFANRKQRGTSERRE